MNEESLPMNEPQEAWAPPDEAPGFDDRISQLEDALALTLAAVARQQTMFASQGLAQQMAAEIGRPESAAALAQELQAVPGLGDAMAAYPVLGEMAKAWASQKLGPSQKEAPLPLTLTGELASGSPGSGRQKQLATDLQKIAGDLGISLSDQDALEVYANV